MNELTLNDVYNVEGLLKKKFPAYEIREGQVKMSSLVMQSFKEHKSAVIEGATGVGKGFAYLIPAIILNEPVIISTSNKNLQNQLDRNDLPALEQVFNKKISWSVLKGKSNYFCHEHFQVNEVEIKESILQDADSLMREILTWAEETEIGDLEFCPIEMPWKIRELIACDNQTTHERDSDGWNNCFAVKARQRAKGSQIVLVNHTLLALDLEVRKESENKASILPDTEYVVIDEAHEFEQAAIRAFSDEISIYSLLHLLNWGIVKKALSMKHRKYLCNALESVLERYIPEKRDIYYTDKKVNVFEGLVPLIDGLEVVVDVVEKEKGKNEKMDTKIKEVIKEARKLQSRLETMGEFDENYLKWSEAKNSKRGEPIIKLKTVPLDISGFLKDWLFERNIVICTSATLSVNNKFDFFRQQVGIPDNCFELVVSSPFDYKEQALIYISDGQYIPENKHLEIQELVSHSKGRAFVLFTSYNEMSKCFNNINIPYPKFMQTQETLKAKLLEEWKSTPNGVLFATRSFWEGVDIKGDQLSLVIIHKIPFGNPYNLIFSSKCEQIDQKAGKKVSFIRYSIPDACIKLKQGVGRLIRSQSDRGVIALLDNRMNYARYKSIIIDSLPNAYRTQKLEIVKRFFDKI